MNQNIVIGRNPLLEVLQSEVELEKIYIRRLAGKPVGIAPISRTSN